MGDMKRCPGRTVRSFLLTAAACLVSGSALAQCIFSGTLPPDPTPGQVPCFITVQPIDVCGSTGGSCAPFNTTSATGVGIPSTAGMPFSNGLPVNETSPNPIGFVVNPATGVANPGSSGGGVDITRTLLNQLGVDVMWLPMATYNSQINTKTGTTFQTLNVTQGATCTGSIGGATPGTMGTTLTITSCSSGSPGVGDTLSGSGIAMGTTISTLVNGPNCNGTYTGTVNIAQKVAAGTMISDPSALFQSADFACLSYQNQVKNGAQTFGPPSGALNPNYPKQPLGWPSNVVNMFFVTTLNPPPSQAGGKLYGFSWRANNGVAIAQSVFGYPRSRTSAPPRPSNIAHEMGHVLGLDHDTFAAGPWTAPPYSNPLGVVPPTPANPLVGECDPSYPACAANLMTTGSMRTEPTVACVLAGFMGDAVPAGCAGLPSLYNGKADQVNIPSSATSTLLPESQQAQVLTGGSGLLSPFLTTGFLNPIPHETTKAQLGTGGSATDPIIFDLSRPTGGKPGETLVAWVLTLPPGQTFAKHSRFHVVSQSRRDLVQNVTYYPDTEDNPIVKDIAYHPGADDNLANPSIGTAADSPCASATAECLMVEFQPPGLGAHDSISFSNGVLKSILFAKGMLSRGGAPITNDDLCKAKITYIFSDGYATTSQLGPCPAVSLPLIASSWRPDPTVSPRIIETNKTNVLLAALSGAGTGQAATTSQPATLVGSAYLNNNAAASNAVIGFSHGAPDVTFSVPSPNPACTGATFAGDTLCFYSGDSTSTTLGAFLASGGATVLTGTPAALASTLNNTVFEFKGTVTVTSGEMFQAGHDDGLQLQIGSLPLVIDAPGPTSFSTTQATYNGPSGTFPFDLVYGECCGGPAVLGISLPLVSPSMACTPDPNDPNKCMFDPFETGCSDCNALQEANQPGQICSTGQLTGIIKGDVTVSAPQNCVFTNPCEIKGDLTINGGMVYLNCALDGDLTQKGGGLHLDTSAHVFGDVKITGASAFTIGSVPNTSSAFPAVKIDGDLQIRNIPGGLPQLGTGTVCGTQVNGDVQVQNNGGAIDLGKATASPANCAGNRVNGDLQCSNNTALTGASNIVKGDAEGQCAAFASGGHGGD